MKKMANLTEYHVTYLPTLKNATGLILKKKNLQKVGYRK